MNQAKDDTGSDIDDVIDENSEMALMRKEINRQYKYQRYAETK